MHPSGSSKVSQVFPAPVGSPISPGANVPDWSATCGSPPTESIWTASSRAMALFVAAAPALAGSCFLGISYVLYI